MRHPQIITFETDGALARSLDTIAQERRWLQREVRQTSACLNLLAPGSPSVLVMKLGRNLIRELTFLDRVHAAMPDVPIVAVSDAEDVTLMSIVLEMGASFVIQPPQPRQSLAKIVDSLMLQILKCTALGRTGKRC